MGFRQNFLAQFELNLQIDDKEKAKTTTYFVFDYCEHDLEGMFNEKMCFNLSQSKRILHSILLGLKEVHSLNIIHRDIKNDNILYNKNRVIKIADFGLSKDNYKRAPHTNQMMQNILYRAPEVLLGSVKYTSKIDIWSLGIVFYQLLLRNQEKPFKMLFIASPLDQIKQAINYFRILGNPENENVWPSSSRNNLELQYFTKIMDQILPEEKEHFNSNLFNHLRGLHQNVDEKAINLLSKMLVLNPEERFSAEQCLDHPFFSQDPQMADFEGQAIKKFFRFTNKCLSLKRDLNIIAQNKIISVIFKICLQNHISIAMIISTNFIRFLNISSKKEIFEFVHVENIFNIIRQRPQHQINYQNAFQHPHYNKITQPTIHNQPQLFQNQQNQRQTLPQQQITHSYNMNISNINNQSSSKIINPSQTSCLNQGQNMNLNRVSILPKNFSSNNLNIIKQQQQQTNPSNSSAKPMLKSQHQQQYPNNNSLLTRPPSTNTQQHQIDHSLQNIHKFSQQINDNIPLSHKNSDQNNLEDLKVNCTYNSASTEESNGGKQDSQISTIKSKSSQNDEISLKQNINVNPLNKKRKLSDEHQEGDSHKKIKPNQSQSEINQNNVFREADQSKKDKTPQTISKT